MNMLGEFGGDDAKASRYVSHYVAPLQRIRATTQWLVVVFSGLAGVLIAGLSISRLEDASGSDFVFASLGIIAALGSIILAVFKLSRVLTATYSDLSNLLTNRIFKEDPVIVRVMDSIALSSEELYRFAAPDLRGLYERLTVANAASRRIVDDTLGSEYGTRDDDEGPDDSEAVAETPGQISIRDLVQAYLNGIAAREAHEGSPMADFGAALEAQSRAATNVVDFANYEYARLAFKSARRYLVGAIVVVVAGVLAFVYFTSKAEANMIAEPIPVIVSFRESSGVGETLGPRCDLASVEGVAVGGTLNEPLVLTVPSESCSAARILVSETIGLALPVVSSD